jgi:hypothetical protein
VIGGEDDEEGEVSEPTELEIGWVGEDEERGEWVATAAVGGLGVIEYLQLDWMYDGTNGWMEKASQPWHPLLYVMYMSISQNNKLVKLNLLKKTMNYSSDRKMSKNDDKQEDK